MNTSHDQPNGPGNLHALLSDYFRTVFEVVMVAGISGVFSVFGMVTNALNIICFARQGFKDPVNISLLGLAISDLGCLVTLTWVAIAFNPLFRHSDIPFDSIDIQYLTGSWPHIIFTRVTAWITAFITLERCLCITMPLKIKTIITPRRAFIVIVFIFIILTASASPVFYYHSISLKFDPVKNKTSYGLVYTSDHDEIETISYAVNNIFVPFGAFLVVITCTTILAVKLRAMTRWRKKIASSEKQAESLSTRDKKIAKTVIMISALFIMCFVPVAINFVGMLAEPELALRGDYKNTFVVIFCLSFALEAVNSSLNIFIYYTMSSKYRAVFKRLCRRQRHLKKKVVSMGSKETVRAVMAQVHALIGRF